MSEHILDPKSFAFDADAEEFAYQKLEDYVNTHFVADDNNGTLTIPAEFKALIEAYKNTTTDITTDYDFLRIIFKTAVRMVDKYYTLRTWVEKQVKNNPDLAALYEKFIDSQEFRVNH